MRTCRWTRSPGDVKRHSSLNGTVLKRSCGKCRHPHPPGQHPPTRHSPPSTRWSGQEEDLRGHLLEGELSRICCVDALPAQERDTTGSIHNTEPNKCSDAAAEGHDQREGRKGTACQTRTRGRPSSSFAQAIRHEAVTSDTVNLLCCVRGGFISAATFFL